MSVMTILLLAFVWSGGLWALATLLCRLQPTPFQAQSIWRGTALLLVLPLIAAPFMPGLPSAAVAGIPDILPADGFVGAPVFEAAPAEAAASGLALPSLANLLWVALFCGWLTRAGLWLRGQTRLQRVKHASRPSSLDAARWAKALGLATVPDVRTIPSGSPFIAGLSRRVIYIPETLADTPDVAQIIAHECVHLKRGDLLTRPVERLVSDLLWFSPFAWLMRERLDYTREAVVDARAADLTGNRVAYARALTLSARLSRPVTPMPVAAFILKKEGTLKMRLTDLLHETPQRPGRLGAAAGAALLLAVPLALAQGNALKGEQPRTGAPPRRRSPCRRRSTPRPGSA